MKPETIKYLIGVLGVVITWIGSNILLKVLDKVIEKVVVERVVDQLVKVIQEWLDEKWGDGKEPKILLPPEVKPSRSKLNISRRRVMILLALILIIPGWYVGSYWGTKLAGAPFALGDSGEESVVTTQSNSTPTASVVTSTPRIMPTPTITPSPIPRGRPVTEINFAWRGDGQCNDYDVSKLGYENQQYYIRPGFSGYIAVCHANGDLDSQGSLQVSAFPEESLSTYGFGVLFGWKGGGLSTTDACIFGVRRKVGYTEAVFIERNEGANTTLTQILPIMLDDNPHTLRVTLHPDGVAQGYLDENFIAEHKFTQCSAGPVGLVAWGPGEKKIYFDDLKLFELP